MSAADPPVRPWDVFQPWDVDRWGKIILDETEQKRWSQAIFLGGLGYMWNEASFVRDALFDRARFAPGQNVLLIGEVLEACGFAPEIRSRIEPEGTLTLEEIVEEARRAYTSGSRGRGGQLATWEWGFWRKYPDDKFDVVAVMQGVQHTDDWAETAAQASRVLAPGGRLILGEIGFGPRFAVRAAADLHISYLLDKIFDRMGWHWNDMPYYSEADLRAAIDPLYEDTGYFDWRGVETFWGTKPSSSA